MNEFPWFQLFSVKMCPFADPFRKGQYIACRPCSIHPFSAINVFVPIVLNLVGGLRIFFEVFLTFVGLRDGVCWTVIGLCDGVCRTFVGLRDGVCWTVVGLGDGVC